MTEDYIIDIERCLYELMDVNDPPQDVLSIAQDLRQEYPKEFNRFTSEMAQKYSLSVCGAHHVHINGLLTILERWLDDGKVEKSLDKGKMLWKKL
ncbi:MAG: hypothetical protein IKV45_03305 [Firmicutes bacterium]|nr:hypothetical protein [Bacillota bacterium]